MSDVRGLSKGLFIDAETLSNPRMTENEKTMKVSRNPICVFVCIKYVVQCIVCLNLYVVHI